MGTANNDEFRALLTTAAGDSTLTNFDDLDGAGGTDTFNLLLEGGAVDLPSGFEISNIEVVNLRSDGTGLLENDGGTGLDATAFTGATQVWLEGATNTATTVDAGDGQTIGFRDTVIADTVTYEDGATAAAIALDGVTSGGTITIAETTGGDLTSVTVNGSVANAGALTVAFTAGTTDVETLNLGLSSDGTITVTPDVAVLTTVDTSASTGDLTINLSAVTALETVTGGAAEETITAAISDDAETTFDLAAGNDAFTLNGTGDTNNVLTTITLGAGGDNITIGTAASNIADAAEAEFADGLIVVTDFSAADDVLDISGVVNNRAVQNTVDAAASGATLLFDAVTAVAATVGGAANDYAIFDFEGDAYIFVDADSGQDFTNGDALIQLTGVSVSDLDATNLIG